MKVHELMAALKDMPGDYDVYVSMCVPEKKVNDTVKVGGDAYAFTSGVTDIDEGNGAVFIYSDQR